ncbi:MAG: DUF3887 domain-containing protein [Armatimonadota bacterium]
MSTVTKPSDGRSSLRRALILTCVALSCLAVVAGCGNGSRDKQTAERFLDYLVGEDFTAATGLLEPGYAKQLPPDRLKQSWTIFRRLAGEFRRERRVRTGSDPSGEVVAITCEFERRTMDLWLVFNSKGQITDMHFVAPGTRPSATPTQQPEPAKPPASKPKQSASGRIAT